jgi:hypothetical protein
MLVMSSHGWSISWLTVSVSQMTNDIFRCRNYNPIISSFMTYHRDSNKSKAMGSTCEAVVAYPSGSSEFTPVFSKVRVVRSLVLCVVFCRSLFVLLSFFFWSLCCLSFFGFWLFPSRCFQAFLIIFIILFSDDN